MSTMWPMLCLINFPKFCLTYDRLLITPPVKNCIRLDKSYLYFTYQNSDTVPSSASPKFLVATHVSRDTSYLVNDHSQIDRLKQHMAGPFHFRSNAHLATVLNNAISLAQNGCNHIIKPKTSFIISENKSRSR